jgi:hypothetical protein
MLALYHNDMSLCEKARVCLSEKGLEWESCHLALREAELSGGHRQVGKCRLSQADEGAGRRGLAAGAGHHPCVMSKFKAAVIQSAPQNEDQERDVRYDCST